MVRSCQTLTNELECNLQITSTPRDPENLGTVKKTYLCENLT